MGSPLRVRTRQSFGFGQRGSVYQHCYEMSHMILESEDEESSSAEWIDDLMHKFYDLCLPRMKLVEQITLHFSGQFCYRISWPRCKGRFSFDFFFFCSLVTILVLTIFRKMLRSFCSNVEAHHPSKKKLDVIKYNVQATCLLSYLVSIVGKIVVFDDAEEECTVGDDLMLGLDLQYLFRYCLTIHLGHLRGKS